MFDLTSIGQGFAPTDENLMQSRKQGMLAPSPEAIQTLSLKMPRFGGGAPPAGAGAPSALMNGPGFGGVQQETPGGMNLWEFLRRIMTPGNTPAAPMLPPRAILPPPNIGFTDPPGTGGPGATGGVPFESVTKESSFQPRPNPGQYILNRPR